MKKPLIVLTGPTAVGKTKLSISLAKAVGGEIISADSMQIYNYMDIGSAKIKPEEMQGVPHYLVDELMPDEEFHIVRFQQMAKAAMEKIYSHGHIPILVGGTGFYIQAVTRDIDFTEAIQEDGYRKELEALAEEKGPEYLHQMLREVDPKSAQEIHANNVKRVIRALEFYHQFTAKKRERGVMDYNDLEQLALEILLQWDDEQNCYVKTAAAEELADHFEEIMIDEYQDSNRVQETLLSAVAKQKEGKICNLFMVGDVKQSIYRFRNACPELFVEKMKRLMLDDTLRQEMAVHAMESCQRYTIEIIVNRYESLFNDLIKNE